MKHSKDVHLYCENCFKLFCDICKEKLKCQSQETSKETTEKAEEKEQNHLFKMLDKKI